MTDPDARIKGRAVKVGVWGMLWIKEGGQRGRDAANGVDIALLGVKAGFCQAFAGVFPLWEALHWTCG